MIVKIVKNFLSVLPKNKSLQVEHHLRKIYHFLQTQPSASFFYIHDFLLSLKFKKPNEYTVFSPIPKQLNNKIIEMSIKNQVYMKDQVKFKHPVLIMDKHSSATLDKLDENIIGFKGDMSVYKDLHEWLFPQIRKYINSPFAFVNTRSWVSKPGGKRYGPNDTHKDGFYKGHIKVMVYSTPLNKKYGELEIEGKRFSGLKEGSSIAFQNSDIEHSGVPGETGLRISTEITCVRSLVNISQEHSGSLLGRHYKSFLTPYYYYIKKNGLLNFLGLILSTVFLLRKSRIYQTDFLKFIYCYVLSIVNKIIKIKKINIGSGRNIFFNWSSLDELDYPGIDKIKLNERVKLPFVNKTISVAYTSHNLEHLDDKTVDRVIKEIARVTKKGGYLVIKIPDFDFFLEKYRENDTNFFIGTGAEGVTWSWKNKKIEDNIENRVAMMICGYWNQEYGDHFSGKVNINDKAYHGPPILENNKLKSILTNNTVREICKELRSIPPKMKDFKAFNHQNAWSKGDLTKLVEKEDFKFIDLNKDEILKIFSSEIPTLQEYKSWSMYTVFQKN